MNQDMNYRHTKIYISEEEEQDLYEKMKDGDELARDDLIMGHKYLVLKMAQEYSSYGSYEDLVQEGFIGLIRAVDKYDLNKARLRSYAPKSIQQQMLRYLNKSRHVIRLPEPQTYALLKLLRIKSSMEEKLGREATTDELMSNAEVIKNHKAFQKSYKSKFTLREYVGLLEFSGSAQSLNVPVFEDSMVQLEDTVEDPRLQSELDKVDLQDLLDYSMKSLNDREKYVLEQVRDGLSGREIGKELNLTTQSVSMIKLNAIKKIKIAAKNDPELTEILDQMGFKI